MLHSAFSAQPILQVHHPVNQPFGCDIDSDISDGELLAACHEVEARCEERRNEQLLSQVDPTEARRQRDVLASQFDLLDAPTPRRGDVGGSQGASQGVSQVRGSQGASQGAAHQPELGRSLTSSSLDSDPPSHRQPSFDAASRPASQPEAQPPHVVSSLPSAQAQSHATAEAAGRDGGMWQASQLHSFRPRMQPSMENTRVGDSRPASQADAQPPQVAPSVPELRVGAVVRVHGLQVALQFNGRHGTCLRFEENLRPAGRWRVQFDSGEITHAKPENLQVLAATSEPARAPADDPPAAALAPTPPHAPIPMRPTPAAPTPKYGWPAAMPPTPHTATPPPPTYSSQFPAAAWTMPSQPHAAAPMAPMRPLERVTFDLTQGDPDGDSSAAQPQDALAEERWQSAEQRTNSAWTCTSCTMSNHSSETFCKACGRLAPSQRGIPGVGGAAQSTSSSSGASTGPDWESLRLGEKRSDPRLNARVMRAFYGSSSAIGVVEDIKLDKTTAKRVYIVKYGESDVEWFCDAAALDARIKDLKDLEWARSASLSGSKRIIDVGTSQDDETRGQSSRKRKADTDSEKECMICMDAEKNTLLDPCGHTVCADCAEKLKRKPCPFCKKKVKKSIRIYS